MTLLKTLFHLTGAITFAFGSYYDWYFVVIPPSVHRMGINFCGKLKFLTYWDAVSIIHIYYFVNKCMKIRLTLIFFSNFEVIYFIISFT